MFRYKLALISVLMVLVSCQPKPDFQYLDGKNGFISQYKGEWVLINFWAEWCKPCLEEIPHLNQFYASYANQIKLVGINFDRLNNDELLVAKDKWKIEYPLAENFPLQQLSVKMPAMLPANVIVSPSGEVFKPLLGPQTEEKLLRAFAKHGLELKGKD